MSRFGHLVRRFGGSVWARPLGDADLGFVERALRPEELACWVGLGRADRAESVATGHAFVAMFAEQEHPADAHADAPFDADARYVAAALLHDVGKADTAFGVIRRSVATVAAVLAGRRRARTWGGALGRYVNHDEIGSARLRQAGARPEAVAWAAVHHRRDLWPGSGIPPEICAMLAVADGEPSGE
jgi:hypothetical protein